jgi:competence protein ComEA
MKRSVYMLFLAVAFLTVAGPSRAAQGAPALTTHKVAGSSTPSAEAKAKAAAKAKVKAAQRARQIDLNSASREELMKIPGITAEMAANIIAGRPYLTKSNLVTHKIMAMDLYLAIKDQVAARQKAATK